MISMLSAFAIVYFNFRGLRPSAFWMIFITLMLPVEVRIMSTYEVIGHLGWLNSYSGLTVPLMASATATFLFRQFYMTIPNEMVEAAQLDGAGPMRFLWSFLVPLSWANIAALFVVLFIFGWNQYLWPLMITNTEAMRTVVIGLEGLIPRSGTELPTWNLIMAGAMMALAASRRHHRLDAALVRERPRGEREVRPADLAAALGCALIVLAVAVVGPAPSGRPPRCSPPTGAGLALWPENSLLAFRNALALGADYLELDVHLSRDGEVMVIHDPTLDRTTTGTGPVVDRTAGRAPSASPQGPESRRHRRGDPHARRGGRAGRGGPGASILLEIKVDAGKARYPGIEERVFAVLDRHGMAAATVVMAFEAETWRRVRALRPEVRAGALYSARALPSASAVSRALSEAGAAGVGFMGLAYSLVTPEAVAEARKAGVVLGAWTVNEPDADADAHRPGDRRPDHGPPGRGEESIEPEEESMTRFGLALAAAALGALVALVPAARAQAPIEGELVLITPVSKFIHDAALKAFADYAKEKWNVTVKVNAIPAGTPVAYGRIVEWKGRPDADVFWGGESALFEKLAEQRLLQKIEISKEAWDSIPAAIGKPKPIPLKDKDGYWVGTALRALRPRLQSQAPAAPRGAAAQGLGRPPEPEAQGRGRPVRADPVIVVERDLRGDPVAVRRGQGLGLAPAARRQYRPVHHAEPGRAHPRRQGRIRGGIRRAVLHGVRGEAGGWELKYVAPKDAFVTPEPMAILAGARNPKAARAFIEFLLTERGQKVFIKERGLFPVTPKFKVQGPPGSTAVFAVEFTGGVRSYFDGDISNVYDEDVAAKRSDALKTRFRSEIEAKWEELKKK